MSYLMKTLVILVVVLGLGCHASNRQAVDNELTASGALALAVDLANKECDARYSAIPFELSTFPITFEDGRWHWGALDQAGEEGLSATVSFGARGEDRKVEVFLSTDIIFTPSRSGDQRD